MNLVLEKGHSRVPVYYEEPTNIIGLILVKLLIVSALYTMKSMIFLIFLEVSSEQSISSTIFGCHCIYFIWTWSKWNFCGMSSACFRLSFLFCFT